MNSKTTKLTIRFKEDPSQHKRNLDQGHIKIIHVYLDQEKERVQIYYSLR